MSAGAYGAGDFGAGLYSLSYTNLQSYAEFVVGLTGAVSKITAIYGAVVVETTTSGRVGLSIGVTSSAILLVSAHGENLVVGAGRNLFADVSLGVGIAGVANLDASISSSLTLVAYPHGIMGLGVSVYSTTAVNIAPIGGTAVVEYMWGPVSVPDGGWGSVNVGSAGWSPVVPLN